MIPVYVAGPLGFSEAGRFFYAKKFLPLLKKVGFECIDPWELTAEPFIAAARSTPEGPAQKHKWAVVNQIIFKNNIEGLTRSKFVVAILDGTDVDSGTACEVGFAHGLNLPIVGYRGDFRLSSDNVGSVVNLQVEGVIRASGGDIVTSLAHLKPLLERWYKRLSTT